MGPPSTHRIDGHIHDHLHSSHDRCNGRSSLSGLRLFRTAAMDILFQHYLYRSEWPGSLSKPPYKDVFPERNHPPVVHGGEPGGFLHSLDHPGWIDGLLQSSADLASALCDTDLRHSGWLRRRDRSVLLGAASPLSRCWAGHAFSASGVDVHRSGCVLLAIGTRAVQGSVSARSSSRLYCKLSFGGGL